MPHELPLASLDPSTRGTKVKVWYFAPLFEGETRGTSVGEFVGGNVFV
jgi:hypothetical protein